MTQAYNHRMIASARQLSNPSVAGSIPAAPSILYFLPVVPANDKLTACFCGSKAHSRTEHIANVRRAIAARDSQAERERVLRIRRTRLSKLPSPDKSEERNKPV